MVTGGEAVSAHVMKIIAAGWMAAFHGSAVTRAGRCAVAIDVAWGAGAHASTVKKGLLGGEGMSRRAT